MGLLNAIMETIRKPKRLRLREKEAHNATDNLKCMRDQYWAWKGEPETNKTDDTGLLKMGLGDYVESGLIYKVLSHMGSSGFFLKESQVAVSGPVPGGGPGWHGYVDSLVTNGDKYHAIEIKTKSGYGADLFFRTPEPSPEYLVQLGLYLECLNRYNITDTGSFLYVLLSDRHFGTVVTINCEYDKAHQLIKTRSYQTSDGRFGNLTATASIADALDRWKRLNDYLEKGEVPAPEYQYKYELTPELLRDIPDAKLKRIVEGNLIYGDWQPMYSRYKAKQLEADGISPTRTDEEKALARAEYKRRHPRSKI